MSDGTETFSSVAELLAAGILRLAELPPDNWRELEGLEGYTVPLLASDYPALTPAMWNAAYREFGMQERNVMMIANPADAGTVIEAFRRDSRYRGGGFGVGFKEVALDHLDGIRPPAGTIGAVNIAKKGADGRLIGANTDGLGYAQSLEELLRSRGESLAGKRILMLGAGGAAKAIAFLLAGAGAELTILNRKDERAQALADRLNAHFGREAAVADGRARIPDAVPRQDVVISAIESDDPEIPLDTFSALGPLEPGTSAEANLGETVQLFPRAKPSLVVSDIRYPRERSALLRQAAELGFATLDGKPMVVNQAIEAFWWIYGEELTQQGRQKAEVAAIMRQAAGMA